MLTHANNQLVASGMNGSAATPFDKHDHHEL